MTDAATPDAPTVTVKLEYVSAVAIGVNEESGALPASIMACVALIDGAALDPSKVVFVITGDFVESVRSRLPADLRHLYHATRGGGIVGGKTMDVGDGVHVIVPSFCFEEVAEPGFDYAERDKLVQRMVLHEAQHVTMLQAGEDGTLTRAGEGEARWNFLACADSVISEYRAEAGVPVSHRPELFSWSPDEVLMQLRSDLGRIATVEYQSHLDVRKFAYDVVTEAQTAWKLLGNIVAARVVGEIAADAAFGADVEASVEWKLMGAPHWRQFAAILADVPSSEVRIAADDLSAARNLLADLFDEWLVTLGFKWSDADQTFRVTSWRLYE